ncbi:hypothetical protein XAC3810_250033 [Xanthomonas citri pv. citri]|nr:hypothetical protein XAC3810_250033 [Xanthomonas citri pv. citri]CEE37876.1 hypothetical protein XAC908_370007 [Xanthomonas citri pv. citri]CEE60334.1 hypothetical protein XACW160_300033 [Xanthomonas citri pv. citri]CEE64550.1 hypothetical protein XAC2852_280032 [Xanthomonas citri pv. citri]CEE70362.1 hypothetical protein XAC3608_480010 [Xanthomonas citri pv. citri]
MGSVWQKWLWLPATLFKDRSQTACMFQDYKPTLTGINVLPNLKQYIRQFRDLIQASNCPPTPLDNLQKHYQIKSCLKHENINYQIIYQALTRPWTDN